MVRRLLAGATAGLLTLGVLAGCSSDSKAGVSPGTATANKKATAKDGGGTITMGGNELPASFPKQAVPLPAAGTLQAAIADTKSGRPSFSLSYGLDAASVVNAAKRYKAALTADKYRIEPSASAGAAAAVFSAYTAIGRDWDVVVYSGGSTETGSGTGFPESLAVQVTAHDSSKDPDPNATAG